jgi:ribosomal protein S11
VKADLVKTHIAAVDSIRATEQGTQELKAQTAEIHTLVNGQSEAKEARIRELEAEVAALKKRKK